VDRANANQSDRWTLQEVAETGSTNADLVREAENGAPDRSVLRTDFQSAGRGRLDRRWEAPAGVNVLASFLFREVPEHPHVLTQVVALAAVQTAAELFGCDVKLKWPNDLMLNDVKVAGVLAQSGSINVASGRPSFVVVGIGINIGWAPEGAAALSAGSSVEQLRESGRSPSHMVRNMCPNIDALLELDRKTLHERYRAHLATIGREVHLSLPGGESLAGRAIDVEVDGRLVVVDECAITHRFDTADVIHLR